VGLFFDGDHIAGALVLAQAKAEKGTRWEPDRGRSQRSEGRLELKNKKLRRQKWMVGG
jgi:hypothetical protein